MSMHWGIHNISEMDSKWEGWDRLNGLYYCHHPYFDSRFIKPCVKYFGGNRIKLAQLKNDQNETTGMILLEKKDLGSWALFSASQMQIIPIILNPKNNGKELKALFNALPGFCWRLQCLYQDPLFTSLNLDQLGSSISRSYHCTTTSIELNQNFKLFWAQRKKSLQQNITRYLNRIEKENLKLLFIKLSQPDELKQGLSRYGLLESLGWKGTTGTAIHPDNSQGLFYNDVIQSFGLSGQASIYELYLNGELAASRLCINNNEMNIMLKTTYNEEMKQFSPGRILLYKMLEKEFEEMNCQKIEFYTNASKDQIDWSSSTRDIYHFEIFRNRIFNELIQLKNRK